MINAPFGFPAEYLLADTPPNYPVERILLTVKLLIAVVFFSLLPIFLARKVEVARQIDVEPSEDTSFDKSRKKNTKERTTKKAVPVEETIVEEVVEIPPWSNYLAVAGVILTTMYLIAMTSPDNYYTTNAVFEAPLLTREECQYILKMADDAAAANFATAANVESESLVSGLEINQTILEFLSEPQGWNKLRHKEYPTTDLNLVTDPFTKENREWLQTKFDARLSPILQRIWGIPPSSIRANDIFIVRYDENKQTRLVNHTDTGYISINVLLDDGFEGGGTRFWNRATKQPFAHIQPTNVGQVLMHSALLNHEGMNVNKGRRTILVGFLDVDRINPFAIGNPPTGLSWFSSWGSLFWLVNKLKQGHKAAHRRLRQQQEHWRNNPYIRSFMGTAKMFLNDFADKYFEHRMHRLVADDNREAFMKALDDAYDGSGTRAVWFHGQQVEIDITGRIVNEWNSRTSNNHRFNEL